MKLTQPSYDSRSVFLEPFAHPTGLTCYYTLETIGLNPYHIGGERLAHKPLRLPTGLIKI